MTHTNIFLPRHSVGGGGGHHFVFFTPDNNRKCRWAFFPFDISTVLELCCWVAAPLQAELALSLPGAREDACSIPQQRYAAEEPSPRPFSSPVPPPSRLFSRPITNSLLRYNDIEFWQLRVFFFFLLSLNFSFSPPNPVVLFPPLFFFLSVCFWRSLISAQRQVGWFELSAKWKPVEL